MTPNQFSVTGGPSKFDLQNALFCWNPRRPALFNATCPVSTAFEVFVLSVEAEDGSGESWNIEGVVGEVQRRNKVQIKFFLPERGQRVQLYFRTDRRQGHVEFFEKGGYRTLAALDQLVQGLNEKQFGDGRPVRR